MHSWETLHAGVRGPGSSLAPDRGAASQVLGGDTLKSALGSTGVMERPENAAVTFVNKM